MQEKKLKNRHKNINSKIKISYIFLLILGFLFFSTISYFLLDNAFSLEYPQLIPLLLGIFFSVFAIVSLYALATLKHYEIKDGKLYIKSITNQTAKFINITDIRDYNEIVKSNKYFSWYDLTLFTRSENIRISSNLITDYNSLKHYITYGKEQNIDSKYNWEYRNNKKFGIGFVLFSTIVLSVLFYAQFRNDTSVTNYSFQKIEGRVAKHLKIFGKDSEESFKVKLKEFPDFTFEISEMNFYYTNPNELVLNIYKNDLVELEILSSTYNKKIAKTEDLSFWEKAINYGYIKAYSLKVNNSIYRATEKDYSEGRSFNLELVIIYFSLFGLLLYGIYLISLPKTITQKE